MPKTALITGITGQDGSYLTELLLDKGYHVHGIIRRASNFNTQRIDHIFQDKHAEDVRLHLHYGDMLDAASLRAIIEQAHPDEVYNLAAQSHVRTSFDQPVYTGESIAIGTANLLEAIRASQQPIRLYQAGSSEMYGNQPTPQTEETPFAPCSPYAAAKVHAYWLVRQYRDAYGLFACNGVLFNHESPRRGETFVTRKITRAATRIKLGLQDKLYLGNLTAQRDWGFAGEYVEGMWRMLQHDEADDYVLATGDSDTVQTFLGLAFRALELNWEPYVINDPRYWRPLEVHELRGDASKARRVLGWEPRVFLPDLCSMMVDSDLELAKQEKLLRDNGHGTHQPASINT